MKRALTLAGGGAKGSYEIGVYKALKELGYNFDIITGTSIGAVNGAMLVQQDEQLATELWNNLTMDKVFVNNGLTVSNTIDYYIDNIDAVLPLVKNYLMTKGADITPFKSMLGKYLNEKKFFSSNIDFALMTVSFPSLTPVEIRKSDIKPGYLKQWVLASASCFPAFPVCEIDGEKYIDGMYYDNVPIDTAFRLGADEVIAVTLKQKATVEKYENHPLVTYIQPSRPLGMAIAFENETIGQNIKLGYFDAMKTLGNLFGNAYTFDGTDREVYSELGKKVLCNILKLENLKTAEEQRKAKLNGKDPRISEALDKMSVQRRNDSLTKFACIVETYMNLFDYDVYSKYDMDGVLKDLVKKSDAKPLDKNMAIIVAAADRLIKGDGYEVLLKAYKPETIISALLLNVLKQ